MKKRDKKSKESSIRKNRPSIRVTTVLLILLAVCAIGCSGFMFWYLFGQPVTATAMAPAAEEDAETETEEAVETVAALSDFAAEEIYYLAGEENTIIFTVNAENISSEIILYDMQNDQAGTMHDDGADGDETAGDSIYTCQISLNSAERASFTYYAAAGDVVSDTETLYFLTGLTDTSEEEYYEVVDTLESIRDQFEDSSGYVPVEDTDVLLDAVEEYLQELLLNGTIVRYVRDEESVYLKLDSGIAVIFEMLYEGSSAGGSDISLTFYAIQPSTDVASDSVDDVVRDLASDFSTESFSYSGSEVTLDLICSIGTDQVILWHGHGGYSSVNGNTLATGVNIDWEKLEKDNKYYSYFKEESVVSRTSDGGLTKHISITSKFIDKYCGDMSSDLIILASCYSGHDTSYYLDSCLPNAFLNKGATAVVGFSDTVYTTYCIKLSTYTLARMGEINDDTGSYYTLSEALSAAKDVYGDSDYDWFMNAYPDESTSHYSIPVIFGGANAKNYRLYPAAGAIQVNVINSKGGFLSDADVIISQNGDVLYEQTTDSNGYVSFNLPDGSYDFTVELDGYQTFTESFEITGTSTTTVTALMEALNTTKAGSASDEEMDIVLLLDISGSMEGTPISNTREAAVEFVETVLEGNDDARISVVTYSDNASVLVTSSSDELTLCGAVSGISDGGGTNMYAGLSAAGEILNSSTADKKLLILMSDGLPNRGESDGDDYDSPVIDLADSLKRDDVTIYAMGFFDALSGDELTQGISLMKQVASSGYYYNITEDGISDAFADMASLASGTLYVNVTIACPVDVAVTYNGETLSSSETYGATRTSFGSVTFEGEDEDDLTKILRLETSHDYEICIYGTGRGRMDYTIAFPDEDGDYTDVREFENIRITEDTQIVTDTDLSGTTLLVDSDGDGKIDQTWYAEPDSEGEQVSKKLREYVVPVLLILLALLVILELILILKRFLRNRRCTACRAPVTKDMKFCPECGRKVERVSLLLPAKRSHRPISRPAQVARIVAAVFCVAVIGGSFLLRRAPATQIYDQVRSHELSSAVWMYESGAGDSRLEQAYLSLLFNHYTEQVEDACAAGEVSETYVDEVWQTVMILNSQ